MLPHLSVALINWGAMAGQLSFVLQEEEEGGDPLPSVDILEKVVNYPLKIRLFRLHSHYTIDRQDLIHALSARGYRVDAMYPNTAIPAWAAPSPVHLIQVVTPSARVITRASEVWTTISYPDEPEPDLLGMKALCYARFAARTLILPWMKKAKNTWGILNMREHLKEGDYLSHSILEVL